jgi:hypothetical protein
VLALALSAVACAPAPAQLSHHRTTLDIDGFLADIAVTDVNADGHLDLLVAGGGVVVLEGDGTGAFRRQERVWPAGDNPAAIATGDLDGDGALDAVVANHDTPYVTILLGDGRGGFLSRRTTRIEIGVDPHPHAVALADMDRDGHLDLLVDDRGRHAVRLLRRAGDGRFRPPGDAIEVGGDPYRGFALGDVNGDGVLDVATPNPRSIAVQLGDGTGQFEPALDSPIEHVAPFVVAFADLDGDGYPDLVAGSEGRDLWAFAGDGTGAFTAALGSPWRIGEGGKKIGTGDLDGDGYEDAVVTSWFADHVAVLLGGADAATVHSLPAGENPWGVAIADLNGDGLDDVVVANAGDETLDVWISR